MTEETSPELKEYFEKIEKQVDKAYELASAARKKGYDPKDKVEIPRARNMAERVIGLISTIAPEIIDTDISQRITQLEKKYGTLDWRVSLVIAEEIAREKFCKFENQLRAIEIGIRIGFAYHTLGTVSSPLEGLSEIKIGKTKDGKEYFKLYFSGPIRSAGGTGASVSVLIADYLRRKFGYAAYDPTEREIKRFATELHDYHERITNLQYLPTHEEIEFLAKHIPVQITGDPSEKKEVSNYKDLERIETNRIRNGVCLVIGEGIAQKSEKLWKQLSKWGEEFGLEEWKFLDDFSKLKHKIHSAGQSTKKEESSSKIQPNFTFINDLVAGRPILTYPLETGGFRLRYGKSRTNGYSATSIHPITMAILDDYIAIGTQLKIERPSKGCTVSSCDTIEGPIVKLENGSVVKLNSEKDLKNLKEKIIEIIFLGDMLISYGDFLNRAHPLVPPGYCEEWWVQELEKAIVDMFGSLDIDKLSELVEVSREELDTILKNPLKTKISSEGAILISKKIDLPLHPSYSYYWKTIKKEQFILLLEYFKIAEIEKQNDKIHKIIIPFKEDSKRVLDLLGIPHLIINKEFVVIEKEEANILTSLINFENIDDIIKKVKESAITDTLEILNSISEIKQRDKAGVFIGARMGRPEKAKMRKLNGSPHVLFPVGKEGGRLKCFQEALGTGIIRGEFPTYFCNKCNKETIFSVCEVCDKKTTRRYHCKVCGLIEKEICPKHGSYYCSNCNKKILTRICTTCNSKVEKMTESYQIKDIDITHYFNKALHKLKTKTYPDLIKGVRGTSNKDHTPEHLAKGIIRARNEVYVNKDGTVRYDMTQMPITHFKPKEIGTSIEKLKELGYIYDIHKKPLEDINQILEIKPQDIILPASSESPDTESDIVLFKVANMCDELLKSLYNLKSFYNLKSKKDLIGHLAIALAPHTSAAIVTRIIGFSKTQAFLAHPMIHAATRRDCDGDEASISLLMDALLNFSRQYLPNHKGATQDAPLVLTSKVIPSEVDDMVFDLDVVWKYPLEFYQACLEYKMPWDISIDILGKRLNTSLQYQDMGFTHGTSDINAGTRCSAYKTLPSMEEKLKGQMEIAEKIRAVDTSDVARSVIEKHFIRDIKGNLRKFSTQEFRCIKCNEKFRRPPLVGKCTSCNGRIIFTVSEGSVVKYLEPSISLANKYNVSPYLKQNLELVKRQIEDVFGKDKERQEGLGKWFG